MRSKHDCIVVNLRTGEPVLRVPTLETILEAADWKTDIALKKYAGETLELAKQAAGAGCEMVIGYGGDGTLNHVVNGIMYKGGKSVAGVIPDGTYNEWATEIGMPEDPVQAALTLVESEARRVDLGHIEVEGLIFPDNAEHGLQAGKHRRKQPKRSPKARQYFLLHAGIGIDAAIMAHISKPFKYVAGRLAFDLAAVQGLPEFHPFPVTVQVMGEDGSDVQEWRGNAWQVVVSKMRTYAGSVDIAPGAFMDDGLLNVCIMTADNPVRSISLALSFLVQHKLDDATTKYFRGTHITIAVPATIGVQVDGSVIKLKDFLHKEERFALLQANNAGQVLINYRFDAVPEAMQTAIPRTYAGDLFQAASVTNHPPFSPSSPAGKQAVPAQQNSGTKGENENIWRDNLLGKREYQVVAMGVIPHPTKKGTCIIAGSHKKQRSGMTEVVAVLVDNQARILRTDGEMVPSTTLEGLQEGDALLVEGNKSKHNIIRARCVRLM